MDTADNSTRLMLAYLCIEGQKTLEMKVELLDRFKLPDAEIAAVCGCAAQSIRNARQQYKKSSKKAKKSK
jgi:hypothetical protein